MTVTTVREFDNPNAVVREPFTGDFRSLDLYRMDCLEGMTMLPKESIDVIVTSPPYNVGTPYDEHDDKMDFGQYLLWLGRRLKQCLRLLKPDGSLFLNLGAPPSDALLPWNVLAYVLDEIFADARTPARPYAIDLFQLQNTIIWVKSASFDGGPVKGHVKPCNSTRFLASGHEYVFHLTKNRDVKLDKLAVGVPFADKSNLRRGSRGRNGDVRDAGTVWVIPYQTIQNRAKDAPHPAPYPVELVRRCLKLHGLDKQPVVLDPFLGLGTTLQASAELNLSGVGFEVSKGYFPVAVRNVVQSTVMACDGHTRKYIDPKQDAPRREVGASKVGTDNRLER